jgi:hypothetical protein
MSNSATIPASALFAQDFTGARVLGKPEEVSVALSPDWSVGYTELFRPVCHGTGAIFSSIAYHQSSPGFFQVIVDALPIAAHETPSGFMASLLTIERCLSGSASDVAKMLRVSRQMIYHYREGMQPAVDNFRRMQLIANIVNHVECDVSLQPIIKLPQPEGKSLLAYLSEEKPDTQVVQRIVMRANTDLRRRMKLAELVGYSTPHDRRDVMRERHASGKPIYVSDPSTPGGLIQIRPDQSRARGRMVNRVFVPDEG